LLEGRVAKMLEGWVAKLAGRPLVTATALGSIPDISFKNNKGAT
jgi:hypothetical protein